MSHFYGAYGAYGRSGNNAIAGLRIVFSTLRPTTARSSSSPRAQFAHSQYRSNSSKAQLRDSSSSSNSPIAPHDPLKSRHATNELGLPLSPLPLSLPTTRPGSLTSEDLIRLHRLSALNPPVPGSAEEQELLQGLNELVGLMDLVKAVKLPPEEIRGLLGDGVREIVFDESADLESPAADAAERQQEGRTSEEQGKELLNWATRRKGDYYAYRSPKRPQE